MSPDQTDAPPATAEARLAAYGPRLELSGNERVPILMELVGAISRATDPRQVQRTFAAGIRRLSPVDGYISISTRGLQPGQYKITRLTLGEDAMSKPWGDPWSDWDQLKTHSGGLLGEVIRSAYPEVLLDLHLADDPVLGDRLAAYRSFMAVPLFDDGEPLNWAIVVRKKPNAFSLEQLENQILRGNLIGGTVRTVLLANRLRKANETIRSEMDRIASIQRALLPSAMPRVPGVSLAASYETFDTAGGDIYSFRKLDSKTGDGADSPWAMLIADASGHGPSAAVVIAMVHAILHAFPSHNADPAEVLAFANAQLCNKRIEHSFVTAFLGVYHPSTRRLVYSRAGHEPPLLMSPGIDSTTERLLDAGSLPLGVLDDATYESAETVLRPQQTLVMYTDGITEARNPDGDQFGIEGIERALHECSGEPECVIGSIATALRAHEAGRRPSDDQTMVALRISDAAQ